MGVKQARKSSQMPAPPPQNERPKGSKGQRRTTVGRSRVYPAVPPFPANAAAAERGSAEWQQDRQGVACGEGSVEQSQEQFSLRLCREVMSENPMCCLPGDPVDVAARLMVTEDVGSLPVVRDLQTTKLIGIVTDRDLTTKVVAEGRDPKGTIVEEVMTHEPVTCHAEENIQHALKIMAEYQVRRVPVIDDNGCLIGIIAQADIATRIAEPQQTAQVVEEISRSPTPRSERQTGTQH